MKGYGPTRRHFFNVARPTWGPLRSPPTTRSKRVDPTSFPLCINSRRAKEASCSTVIGLPSPPSAHFLYNNNNNRKFREFLRVKAPFPLARVCLRELTYLSKHEVTLVYAFVGVVVGVGDRGRERFKRNCLFSEIYERRRQSKRVKS